jgi:hypothetical protein
MNKVIIAAIVASSIFGNSAFAQPGCRYNGQLYPVGAKLGNLTCTASGAWK